MSLLLKDINNKFRNYLFKDNKKFKSFNNKSFKGTSRHYGESLPCPLSMWMLSDEDMMVLGKTLEDYLNTEEYTYQYEINAQRLGAFYYENVVANEINIHKFIRTTEAFKEYIDSFYSKIKNEDLIFYISGKISGLDIKDAESKFLQGRKEIREKFPNAGYIDPSFVSLGSKGNWDKYMDISLSLLKNHSTAIYMLDNYSSSKGAIKELETAKELGLKIEYQ